MSLLGLILLIMIILLLLGAVPRWPYSRDWGYGPSGLLGAVLITALMGGTAAVHFVAGNPLFSHLLFGPYLAVFAWGGLWLRDAKLRELIPLRR